ncbi:MAG: TRAP transporter substrate-binding protein DctP [Chloroflexota bacterium]
MDRRQFLKSVGTKAVLGAAVATGAACGTSAVPSAETIAQDSSLPEISWQMATSWPVALDTIFGGAQAVADSVTAMTGGKFTIEARAAGELAPGLEVLNVVQEGAVPIGHTASYYYVGKSPITAFGTAMPFGLTSRQQNAWLYEGGGLSMLQEAYAERFGVIQFPAGNTGVQMGGWFNKEINSIADMEGLKMRIPGLGGQVMDRLGVNVQVLPGGEIFQALQTGAIDAAEWVGPYDDEKLGFHKAASFYYFPGWWEPGPSLEIQINQSEYDALPEEYQAILQAAAYQANMTMMARYDAKNPAALNTLLNDGDITLLPFPDDVMQASEEAAFELFDEFAASDTDFGSILTQWSAFREGIQAWHGLAETGYLTYGASR